MLEVKVDSDGGVETAGTAGDVPADAGHAVGVSNIIIAKDFNEVLGSRNVVQIFQIFILSCIIVS